MDAHTIAALYVLKNGPYFGLPGVDPWDEERDARLYDGPYPVVAHPPCSRWCQLAFINEKRYGHRVGDDGGCFESALAAVRRWGGVLEHPARSYAWSRFDLARPRLGVWLNTIGGGWVTEVSQGAYGHRARKLTWLYFFGVSSPPVLDWSVPEPTAQVSFCKNHGNSPLPRLSKMAASRTPPRFRDLLISLARSVYESLPARPVEPGTRQPRRSHTSHTLLLSSPSAGAGAGRRCGWRSETP